jgi:hypothetical protein
MLEAFGEGEKPLHVCQSLSTIKAGRNHGGEFRAINCEAQ